MEAFGVELEEVTFEEWMTHLEDGSYPKGVEALCKMEDGEVTGFCCLGVYTDLLIKKNPDVMSWSDGGEETCCLIPVCNGRKLDISFPSKELFPFPFNLAPWRDNTSASPLIGDLGDMASDATPHTKEVATMNDRGMSFKDIAQKLRAEYARKLEEVTPITQSGVEGAS